MIYEDFLNLESYSRKNEIYLGFDVEDSFQNITVSMNETRSCAKLTIYSIAYNI